jgi:hypothetical protein
VPFKNAPRLHMACPHPFVTRGLLANALQAGGADRAGHPHPVGDLPADPPQVLV